MKPSGKTTTINILNGTFSSSGGDAFLEGFSVKESRDEIRKRIGVCPQDVLIPFLVTPTGYSLE